MGCQRNLRASCKGFTPVHMQAKREKWRCGESFRLIVPLQCVLCDSACAARFDGEDYRTVRSSAAEAPAEAAPPPARIDLSGGVDPTRADTPEEVEAVLAQLTRMRDSGAISSGEYEIKKKELLNRL